MAGGNGEGHVAQANDCVVADGKPPFDRAELPSRGGLWKVTRREGRRVCRSGSQNESGSDSLFREQTPFSPRRSRDVLERSQAKRFTLTRVLGEGLRGAA